MNKPIIYTDQGSGPVLLFVHGFCESKAVWKDFTQSLTENYRVICPDLPGFGESALDQQEVSMEWFAEGLHKLLELLNIKEYIFVGHSLGGYVGLALAEKFPAGVKGFCLFHSTAYADSEERKENRNKTYAFIQKHGVNVFAQSFIEPLFSLKNRVALKEDIEKLKAIAAASSEKGVLATTLAMRDRPDRTHVLSTIKCPTLLIGGKNDATIPPDKIEEQATLSSLIEAAIVPDCGHMGMFEQKEATLVILKDFFKNTLA